MNKSIFFGALIALVGLIGANSVYTVQEGQQALVFQLGEIVGQEQAPGLKYKLPFIQNVVYYDRRLLPLETPALQIRLNTGFNNEVVSDNNDDSIITNEAQIGETISVQSFARFHITDPQLFFRSHTNEETARVNLNTSLRDAINSVLGKSHLDDVLSNAEIDLDTFPFDVDLEAAYKTLLLERATTDEEIAEIEAGNYPSPRITDIITAVVNDKNNVRGTGVLVHDVRFTRVTLPDANRDAIYRQMITERQSLAEQLRAEGRAQATEIRANAERERDIRLAEALSNADIVRGEGDSDAIATYGAAYGQDPEFYAFYRSLEAYRTSMGADSDTMMVLSPTSDFFEFFGDLPD